MITLQPREKDYIKSELKKYLENDDIVSVMECLYEMDLVQNGDPNDIDVPKIAGFLYELGLPLLDNLPKKVGNLLYHDGYVPPSLFYNAGLDKVEIPSSVREISNWSFYKNKLTSVTIPDGVQDIGYQSFGCNPLSEVIFEGVTRIETSAFYKLTAGTCAVWITEDMPISVSAFEESTVELHVPQRILEDTDSYIVQFITNHTWSKVTAVPY